MCAPGLASQGHRALNLFCEQKTWESMQEQSPVSLQHPANHFKNITFLLFPPPSYSPMPRSACLGYLCLSKHCPRDKEMSLLAQGLAGPTFFILGISVA